MSLKKTYVKKVSEPDVGYELLFFFCINVYDILIIKVSMI